MDQPILVADDNRGFAELLRATLEEEGYEVVTASTGLAAVTCLERHDIGLAVLDVLMPGISGDAVADRLLRVKPDLPVILYDCKQRRLRSRRRSRPAGGMPWLR